MLETDPLERGLTGLSTGLCVATEVGVWARFLVAYGSAVAGRPTSGLRGRRMGADMREPCAALEVLACDFAGLAAAAVAVGLLTVDNPEAILTAGSIGLLYFTGESSAIAEFGRSGSCLAAACL